MVSGLANVIPWGAKSYATVDPERAVMVIVVVELRAPAGTVTVTPAAGMDSFPPALPMFCVTVMSDGSAVVRCRLATSCRSRRPPRSWDGASGALAEGATGAVVD